MAKVAPGRNHITSPNDLFYFKGPYSLQKQNDQKFLLVEMHLPNTVERRTDSGNSHMLNLSLLSLFVCLITSFLSALICYQWLKPPLLGQK